MLDLGAQTFVRGLLTVLVVVAAVELLPLGDPGVGTLNAMIGLGGLLGAMVAVLLAGRERLGPAFLLALAGWGLPIAVFGLVADGRGVAPGDDDGRRQQLGPRRRRVHARPADDARTRAASRSWACSTAWPTAAWPSAASCAPVLIVAFGTAPALVVTGAILPIVALLSVPVMRRIDEGGPAVAQRVDLLRADPLFAPLSLATIEYLSSCLRPVAFEDGAWLMREGEPGMEYLLIETGHGHDQPGWPGDPGRRAGQRCRRDRAAPRRPANGIGPGPWACRRPSASDRGAFLEAVTGHPVGRVVATTVAEEHLAADRERPALH